MRKSHFLSRCLSSLFQLGARRAGGGVPLRAASFAAPLAVAFIFLAPFAAPAVESNSGSVTYAGGVNNAPSATESTYGPSGHEVNGDYANSGTVTGQGGPGGSLDASLYWYYGGSGLKVDGNFVNTGTVYGRGGNGGSGIWANGGNGLSVAGDFTNNATVTGYGGSGGGGSRDSATGGNGLSIGGDFTNNATVTGYGGNGLGARGGSGLSVDGDLINTGTVTGYGGTGGSGDYATSGFGLIVRGYFTNIGTVTGYGGIGGSGDDAYGNEGLYLPGGMVNNGLLVAQGGARGTGSGAFGGYGVTFGEQSVNNGTLALFSGASQYAAAVEVSFSPHPTFTFASGSLLLAGAGSYAGVDASPDWFADPRQAVIENGAQFVSLAASGLSVGQTHTHDLIVEAASITGEFTSVSGPVLAYTQNNAGTEYQAMVTRLAYASSIVSSVDSPVVAALERAFAKEPATPETLQWAALLANVENQPDVSSVRRAASGFGKGLSPMQTAQGMRSMLRGTRMAGDIASGKLQALGKGRKGTAAERRYALTEPQAFTTASDAVDNFSMWVQPFVSWGEQRGTGGYSDLDENYRGASMGFAYDTGPVVLSLSGHYIRAEFDSSGYDADADALGITLGLGRSFRINDTFAPWAELRLGWTNYELRQERKDIIGETAFSRPDVNVYSAGVLVNNDFTFGSVTVTPGLGLDYSYMDMDKYSEHGSVFSLRVNPEEYESLRGKAGVDVSWQALPSLSLEGRAAYYLEMLDNRGELRTSAVSLPSLGLTAKGEDVDRSSGSIGAGFQWQASDAVSFGLDYDFGFGDHYTGHTLTGMFKVSF